MRILNGETREWLLSFERFRWPDSVRRELELAKTEEEDGLAIMARLILRDVAPAYRDRDRWAGTMICSEILRGLTAMTQAELDELAVKMRESLKEA